jgi:hypothetical protein
MIEINPLAPRHLYFGLTGYKNMKSKVNGVDFSVINWMNCVWKSNLPPYCKYLASYLRKFMNDEQDIAWPSYARIIHETGLSRGS